MSDALIIPRTYVKPVFYNIEYLINIPPFELLQHSEYHVKITARIISNSSNSFSSILHNFNPLMDYIANGTTYKRDLRDAALVLQSASKLKFYKNGSLFD